MDKPQVVVIGAGMAGLAAAYTLSKAGVAPIVMEKSDRVGGRLRTDDWEGLRFDVGAQILARFYSATLGLVQELQLQGALRPIAGSHAILRAGHLYPLDAGPSTLFTRLISWDTKARLLRLLREPVAHWRDLDIQAIDKAYALDTESLAAYVQRTVGSEAVEYLMEPPLSGVFYWTPEQTSTAMLFLLLKVATSLKLLTLEGGLERLPEMLAARLPVRCGAEVVRVARSQSNGYTVRVREHGEEHELTADGLVCAIPGQDVPQLIADLTPPQRNFFGQVRYSATAVTAIGVANQPPSPIHSFFCPRSEVTHLGAVTTESGKHPSTPQRRDVYTLFAKGTAGPELLAEDDAHVHAVLKGELEATGFAPSLGENMAFHREYRWDRAVPCFGPGSFVRLHEFAAGSLETDTLVFAGDYLGGPFVEGAVVSGQGAAKRLLSRLATG